ncbi:hypothetical protein LINPERPRIM_LOCUS32907 [Linum perenne]
MSNTRIGH